MNLFKDLAPAIKKETKRKVFEQVHKLTPFF